MSDPRPWTYAALFGALWGALELSAGTVLHLAQFPFTSVVMSLLGLLCLVTLRRLQPLPGVCLLAGMVAVFLKVFTMGGLFPGPLVALAVQSLLVEAVFIACGCRPLAALLAGAGVVAMAPVQKVVVVRLVAGGEALAALERTVMAVLGRVVAEAPSGLTLLGLVIAVSAATGAAGGQAAWIVSGRVLHRVGRGG